MAKTANKRNQKAQSGGGNRSRRTQNQQTPRGQRAGQTRSHKSKAADQGLLKTFYDMEQHLPFDKTNYRLMIATFALMVLGYIFISFSDAVDLMAAHIGVTFVMVATVLGVVAILKTPKHETETELELQTDDAADAAGESTQTDSARTDAQ